MLAKPPKCGLILPRPSLLTLPQTPQEFLYQHAHPTTQQTGQQFQQRAGARFSFSTSNPIHPTATPKRGTTATNAMQVQKPHLRISRQSQRAEKSTISSITGSSDTFGAVNVASQYAPSEIPQPANSHQNFTTASRQPTRSFATTKAQITMSSGSFKKVGHEYLGNRSTLYPSREQSFMRQNEPYTGFGARYDEQAPSANSVANIPQTLTRALYRITGAFLASLGSLNPPQGSQQMEIPTGSRIEHEDTLRNSSPPRLSPRAQGWLNYWEVLYFSRLQVMENDMRQQGFVPPSYGQQPWERQTRKFDRLAFRQSFYQQLMRYCEVAWLEHVSILDHAKHSAGHHRSIPPQKA